MIILVIDRKDGTFGSLGPLADRGVALAYKEFIEELNPHDVECHVVNILKYQPPGTEHVYPWETNNYTDGE